MQTRSESISPRSSGPGVSCLPSCSGSPEDSSNEESDMEVESTTMDSKQSTQSTGVCVCVCVLCVMCLCVLSMWVSVGMT